MKRSPIRRRTWITRRRSDRLVAATLTLAHARPVVSDRDGHRCVRCDGRGAQVHHRRPRGAGGASRSPEIHALSNLILLCVGCHEWVERNRAEAKAQGWLVPAGVTGPAEVPVMHALLGWVLLDDDGGVALVDAPGGRQ